MNFSKTQAQLASAAFVFIGMLGMLGSCNDAASKPAAKVPTVSQEQIVKNKVQEALQAEDKRKASILIRDRSTMKFQLMEKRGIMIVALKQMDKAVKLCTDASDIDYDRCKIMVFTSDEMAPAVQGMLGLQKEISELEMNISNIDDSVAGDTMADND